MKKAVLLAAVLLALLVAGTAFAGGQVRWEKDGVVIAWGTAEGGQQPIAIAPDSRGGRLLPGQTPESIPMRASLLRGWILPGSVSGIVGVCPSPRIAGIPLTSMG